MFYWNWGRVWWYLDCGLGFDYNLSWFRARLQQKTNVKLFQTRERRILVAFGCHADHPEISSTELRIANEWKRMFVRLYYVARAI
jgi:hypothetical protein